MYLPAIARLEGNWLPFLELNPGEKAGVFAPHPGPSCRREGALAAGWHPGCRSRASSAGAREQRGSWEQHGEVRVTQRFLAWGAAGASRAQRERGGQAGRNPLEEPGQRTTGLRSWDKGPGNARRMWCGGSPGEGQAGARPPGSAGEIRSCSCSRFTGRQHKKDVA